MAGAGAAVGFRDRDAEKTHVGEALPQFAIVRLLALEDCAHRLGRAFFGEKFSRLVAELFLFVGEIEIHGTTLLCETYFCTSSPRTRRAVRGKSAIAELQLVGGDSLLAFAGVDGWRFGNGGDRSPREQELTDELREPERKHGGAVHSCRDAQ